MVVYLHIFRVLPQGVATFAPLLLPKLNIDTKNNCLEKVSPFKHGYFGYLCEISGRVSFFL